MNVVIVESPSKAKTIHKYLGPGYQVLASYGHVRDLPPKDGSVDPNDDFRMIWQIDGKAQKRLAEIADAVKGADKLILATDPDREGEAISWHVLEILKEKGALKDQKIERVVFNAITKKDVIEAIQHPRQIDAALVDAYRARRALDFLVGFTLSPVLWRKLPGSRSAGRVQSVALRLVCDRERDIEIFVPQEYWSIVAQLATVRGDPFEARLVGADGKKLQRLDVGSKAQADDLRQALETATFKVASVESKPTKRHPYPPFTTSTLQQEASRKLGFAPSITMRIAQRLYEGADIDGETVGLITYMRTDGIELAGEAIAQARSVIAKDYGQQYVSPSPRVYKNKSKHAQEAHEAIRPTDLHRRPRDVARYLDADQAKLYELIWLRTLACQMELAELERTTAEIEARAGARTIDLRATGTVIKFDGFLTLYQEGHDDDEEDEESKRLPEMNAGEPAERRAILSSQHFTEPPPRFSEASLVKRMEELGIGRPSTYASVLQVLRDRGYVRLDKKRLIPEDKGRVVIAFLEAFFMRYVEYDFTADLEEKLDKIANAEIDWREVLRDFWRDFIAAVDQIKDVRLTQVIDALDEMLAAHVFPPRADGVDPRVCPQCGTGRLNLKIGRFGGFVGCSNYPECRYTRQLMSQNGAGATRVLGKDPVTGLEVTQRDGRFGPYVQLGENGEKDKKDKKEKKKKEREAETRRPAQGHRAGLRRSRAGAQTPGAAARDRTASGDPRTDHGRHRPLRHLCEAQRQLRQSRTRRRRARHRPQPRGDLARRKSRARTRPWPRPPHRQAAWRPSDVRRPRQPARRPLRALCLARQGQRHDPGDLRSRQRHAGGSRRADRRARRAHRREAAEEGESAEGEHTKTTAKKPAKRAKKKPDAKEAA